MVLNALKKMMGRKHEDEPVTPILDMRPQSPGPRESFRIPTVDDIPGMAPPTDIPEPPHFPSPAELAPVPPAIEERRRQRIENFRRTRPEPQTSWTAEPQAPQEQWITQQPTWSAPPASTPALPQHKLVERRPQTVESALGTVLDHLDRIEQRIIDVDRRLAMLESGSRVR
ncbi:MAG: hypothetical protein HY366_03400 [Candidatus Aenigmarchaeota archaeon]|nr:hypothetical protein [Candidatus Aenigmarchaeota archaeon]